MRCVEDAFSANSIFGLPAIAPEPHVFTTLSYSFSARSPSPFSLRGSRLALPTMCELAEDARPARGRRLQCKFNFWASGNHCTAAHPPSFVVHPIAPYPTHSKITESGCMGYNSMTWQGRRAQRADDASSTNLIFVRPPIGSRAARLPRNRLSAPTSAFHPRSMWRVRIDAL